MPGVNVTVSGQTIQGTRTTVSESNGTYRLTLLPPGTYQVVYQLDGFATLTTRGQFSSALAEPARSMRPCEVAALSDAVTVTGETPVVDLQSVTRGTNYDDRLLDESSDRLSQLRRDHDDDAGHSSNSVRRRRLEYGDQHRLPNLWAVWPVECAGRWRDDAGYRQQPEPVL